jgi:hypothetical protein
VQKCVSTIHPRTPYSTFPPPTPRSLTLPQPPQPHPIYRSRSLPIHLNPNSSAPQPNAPPEIKTVNSHLSPFLSNSRFSDQFSAAKIWPRPNLCFFPHQIFGRFPAAAPWSRTRQASSALQWRKGPHRSACRACSRSMDTHISQDPDQRAMVGWLPVAKPHHTLHPTDTQVWWMRICFILLASHRSVVFSYPACLVWFACHH